MKIDRKSLPDLMWYRLLKVIFYFAWAAVILVTLVMVVIEDAGSGFWVLVIYGAILEIIRRAFFYITTGIAADKKEIAKLKVTGVKTAKGLGNFAAFIVAAIVFGIVIKTLPFIGIIGMGMIISIFNLEANQVLAANLEAVGNIAALVFAYIAGRQTFKAIAKPVLGQKKSFFSWL